MQDALSNQSQPIIKSHRGAGREGDKLQKPCSRFAIYKRCKWISVHRWVYIELSVYLSPISTDLHTSDNEYYTCGGRRNDTTGYRHMFIHVYTCVNWCGYFKVQNVNVQLTGYPGRKVTFQTLSPNTTSYVPRLRNICSLSPNYCMAKQEKGKKTKWKHLIRYKALIIRFYLQKHALETPGR